MITFKPVELADKPLIEAFTLKSDCRNCDLSFGNIYCWREHYRSAWAVVEGFLVIRFFIDGGRKIGYMQPLGEGDFTPILPALAEDAHRNGQRLRLIGLSDEACAQMRRNGCREFAFDADRALADYIYLAEDLRTLPGRKYQPKRNHINRFTAEYDYRYEPLVRERFDECLLLEAEWRQARSGQGHTSEMGAEQRAMQQAFAHFEELGMRGGCLYVGGRLAAFTYGSPLNGDTFDCHVEKADTEYDGAFAMINKLFAEHLPAEYRYINREEDMGLEGLRRSKLSYHPALLGNKSTAIHLHADERACKKLWQEAFGDEEPFIDRFLIRYYSRRRLLSVTEEERLLSMLHLIPFQSELGRTLYVYGVATALDCRRRGLATKLMNEALERARKEAFDAVILIPAEEWLRGFYGRFGFCTERPVRLSTPDGFDFGTGDAALDRALILPLHDLPPLPDELHGTYDG